MLFLGFMIFTYFPRLLTIYRTFNVIRAFLEQVNPPQDCFCNTIITAGEEIELFASTEIGVSDTSYVTSLLSIKPGYVDKRNFKASFYLNKTHPSTSSAQSHRNNANT